MSAAEANGEEGGRVVAVCADGALEEVGPAGRLHFVLWKKCLGSWRTEGGREGGGGGVGGTDRRDQEALQRSCLLASVTDKTHTPCFLETR